MAPEQVFGVPAYLRSLIDAIQDGFVLRSGDGTVVDANQAFLDMVGFDRDEVIGSRPPHVWWPDDETRAAFQEAGQRYLRGEASEDRVIYRRKDGATFPALVTSGPLRDGDGRLIGFVGTIKDISAWAVAERRLAFQAQLIDQVQAAVVATDAAGRVVLWSTGAEELFGYQREAMVGRDLIPLLIETAGRVRARSILARLAGQEPWEGELDVPRRDGGRLPVLTAISSLCDMSGGLAGYVIAAVDLRERKRAESRIAAQYQVARVLTGAESLAEGIHAVLEAVGDALGCRVGMFWTPGAVTEDLQCVDVWSAPGVDVATFELESRRGALIDGLPGRTWRRGEPQWVSDVAIDPGFQRAESALAVGVRSGVAVPVEAEGRILGVIEFFSAEPASEDESLVTFLMTIGRQVGQFIERRKALASLRESEDRFRTMAESVPVMLWLTSASGHVEYFNRVWREFTGRPTDQDLGDGWIENLHPDDVERTLAAYRAAFDAQTTYEVEYRLRRHDGEYCWVLATGIPRFDADGVFRGYTGSCIDIDERRRTEENQRFLSEATRVLASSLDYHTTLASVARLAVPAMADWCVIHIMDDDGRLQREAIAHVDPERVEPARDVGERFPDDPELESALDFVVRTGEPRVYSVVTDEMLAESADDDQHLDLLRRAGFTSAMIMPIVARERVLGVISLVRSEEGRHYGPEDLAIAQHLARRSAVAIDNSRLYREAQESTRARDQFLAVAAHELRSPLTSMKGFAQLLLRRASKSASGEEWLSPLKTIDAQVNRMTELVNRLLDVSRIEEKRLQLVLTPADLRQIVTAAVVEARMTTENHTVRYDGTDEPVVLELDSTRVTQVLSNLLDNAIRYSPPGTTVTVDLRADDDGAVVSVHDEGPGVPPQLRDRLFERYFSGMAAPRGSAEGLGLGLYVASGIVEAHNGAIWVDGDGERGATFRFRLPWSATATLPGEEA